MSEAPAAVAVPRCAAHPEADAVGGCTRCGSFFCAACKGWEHGRERYCVRCDPGGPYVAWEDRERKRGWPAFLETQKSLLLKPDRFFVRMPASGGYGRPLLFAWIGWALASFVTAITYGLLMGGIFAIMPMPEGEAAPVGQVILGVTLGSVAAALMGIVPFLFLWTLALHLTSKMFGGEGSFEATFRAYAYSSGVMALGVIPLVGLSAAQIYWVILQILAVKHVHRLSTARAVAAVLVLPMICCGLYFATAFGLGFLSAAAQ